MNDISKINKNRRQIRAAMSLRHAIEHSKCTEINLKETSIFCYDYMSVNSNYETGPEF